MNAHNTALNSKGATVYSEHVLIGLCQEPDTVGATLLSRMGLDLDQLVKDARSYITFERNSPTTDMTLSPEGKRLLDLAYMEARSLQDDYIGTEHLALGLIAGHGRGSKVLANHGADLEHARSLIRDQRNEQSS